MTISYSFREYMAHLFVNTPFDEPVLFLVHKIREMANPQKSPELSHLKKEPFLAKQVVRRLIQDPMNCIDIGAHFGRALSQVVKLSPHGKHIAVEVVPYKAQWLREKFPTVEVLEIAVSDTPGLASFYHYRQQYSGFSGLHPFKSIKEKLGDHNEIQFTVKCERLDTLIPADKRIDFMIIELETDEFNLRSAQQTLQRCRPHILFHCSRAGLGTTHSQPSGVFNFLTQHHYNVFLPEDWLNGNQPLDIEQFSKAIMHYPFRAFEFLATQKKS